MRVDHRVRPAHQRTRDASAPAREALNRGLEALGLPLRVEQRVALVTYLDLLVRWNAVYNLTAVRDPLDMVALHLLDSLAVHYLVAAQGPGSVLDVGTGAGLPGIPLAVVEPERPFVLVDAVAKKVAFVRQAATTMKLQNIDARHARVEALALTPKPALIVSRAFSDLTSFVVAIDTHAGDHTTVIAMKAARPDAEIAALPSSWTVRRVETLHVPSLGADRCAVVLGRTRQADA